VFHTLKANVKVTSSMEFTKSPFLKGYLEVLSDPYIIIPDLFRMEGGLCPPISNCRELFPRAIHAERCAPYLPLNLKPET
jgi:hypothetical protein